MAGLVTPLAWFPLRLPTHLQPRLSLHLLTLLFVALSSSPGSYFHTRALFPLPVASLCVPVLYLSRHVFITMLDSFTLSLFLSQPIFSQPHLTLFISTPASPLYTCSRGLFLHLSTFENVIHEGDQLSPVASYVQQRQTNGSRVVEVIY